MHAQMENFIREKEILRKIQIKILEIKKKMISEMGNSIDWLISRIETVEGRINKLENKLIKLIEIIQTKHKGEKRV